jgi:hypothetical protein
LRNLPEDPERPWFGREGDLLAAQSRYLEARRILHGFHQAESIAVISQVLAGFDQELTEGTRA